MPSTSFSPKGFSLARRNLVSDMAPGMYNPLRQIGLPAKREPVLKQAGAQGVFKGKGLVEIGGHVAGVVG